MENPESARKRITARLSAAEVSMLLSLGGLNAGKASPLSAAGAQTSKNGQTAAKLQQAGLLEAGKTDRLTPDCLAALKTLAGPDVEIGLVWGDATKTNLTNLFATTANGSDAMVAFTGDGIDRYSLSYFLSHKDVTELVRDRIAFTRLEDKPSISYETDASGLAVLFAVLDLYEEARLKAALDRTRTLELDLSLEAVKRVLVDAKTGSALDWYTPLGYLMLPRELPDDSGIKTSLQILQKAGAVAIDKDKSALGASLAAFAFRAFPVVTYLGINVRTRSGSPFGGAQFMLLRSLTTLLLVQRASDKNGEKFSVRTITTSEVPEMLFNLATLPFAAPPAPQKSPEPAAASPGMVTCAKCGTKNPTAAKFCTKCGASLAAPQAQFCPKCGDPVKAGEKFCDKCGGRLT